MGNVCEFEQPSIVTSLDEHQQSKVFHRGSMRRVNPSPFSSVSLERQTSLQYIKSNTLLIPQSEYSHSKKYLADHDHKMSIIPPSQHSISKFRKLEEQSQVPSDFFDNVDFSVYFQTFKHLKENISHQFFHHNDEKKSNTGRNLQSANSFENGCNQQNGDSLKEDEEGKSRTQQQMSDKEKENENRVPMELKKTKLVIKQIEIIRY